MGDRHISVAALFAILGGAENVLTLFPVISFIDTVGKNKQKIQEYIKRQLEQDQIADQLSLKEFTDPFTGSKGTKA